MRNYIEFCYDEDDNYIAKIHKEGRVRVIRNEANLEKLISIAEKYGYEINGVCRINARVFSIAGEYEKYYKKRNVLRIIGRITPNMKLTKKEKAAGKKIAAASLAAVIIISGIGIAHGKSGKKEPIDYQYEIILDDQMEPNMVNEVIMEDEIEDTPDEEEEETLPRTGDELQDMMQEEAFHFSYKNRQDEENISNAKRYEDLFQKYAVMYGLDANLLMAIAAQESCGDHYSHLDRGPAEGIMQIEKSVHIGENVSAYNFEKGEVETIYVTRDKLQDLETNIKIGAMILRSSIENCRYNIPLGIQSYNFGPGNMAKSIAMCCDLENLDEDEIKYNPTNNVWLKYRAFLNTGDPQYIEHVFSFMDNDTKITVLDRDGNPISIRITNDYEKQNVY